MNSVTTLMTSHNTEGAAVRLYPAFADAEQIYDVATDPTEQNNLVAGGTVLFPL
jgi:hypothetical protein